MEYMSVKQAAKTWGISERIVQRYCTQGRIEGAAKVGGSWLIPVSAGKPSDPRRGITAGITQEIKILLKSADSGEAEAPEKRPGYATAPAGKSLGHMTMPAGKRSGHPTASSEKSSEYTTTPAGKSTEYAAAPVGKSMEYAAAPVGKSMEYAAAPVDEIPPEHIAMPLMNSSFRPGFSGDAIVRIEDADDRNMALAEYYFFTGQSEKASDLAAPYLKHGDLALKLSTCWVFAYANLSLDRIPAARYALNILHTAAEALDENSSERDKALGTCISTGAGVLLHLPMPKTAKPRRQYISRLQPGLRLFVLYVEAHYAYLGGNYGVGVGIAETALALESDPYPIPTIYLHLAAAMNHMNLRNLNEAKEHVLEAWKIAQPDKLIEPFAEHHGLLGGLLEATLKKDYPEAFRQMIQITYKFSAGWRKIHNPETGENVADNLTTTEFAVAMLAARGWTNQEIAAHMGVSEHTVRHHLSIIFQKLNITQRKELQKYMLK